MLALAARVIILDEWQSRRHQEFSIGVAFVTTHITATAARSSPLHPIFCLGTPID